MDISCYTVPLGRYDIAPHAGYAVGRYWLIFDNIAECLFLNLFFFITLNIASRYFPKKRIHSSGRASPPAAILISRIWTDTEPLSKHENQILLKSNLKSFDTFYYLCIWPDKIWNVYAYGRIFFFFSFIMKNYRRHAKRWSHEPLRFPVLCAARGMS